MILDVTIIIALGRHKLHPQKTANLTDKCCVCSDCFTNRLFPISPLLRPPYSLGHNNMDIRPITNPTMASKCSGKRKSCKSLTLNQKLERIQLSEEGTSKAKQTKARPLAPVSQAVNVKGKFLKEMKCCSSELNGKNAKQPFANMEKALVVQKEDKT